jgi:hypothetical protein
MTPAEAGEEIRAAVVASRMLSEAITTPPPADEPAS